MQDRFKFRTYLPDLKFFKYWGWIKDSHYIDLCACGDYQKPELLEKYTNQCTGLKDKNGTLIYEGDIVKIEYYDFEIKHRIGIVEWEDDGFCITYHNPKDTKVSGCSLVDIVNGDKQEVIGNIYETPELIGGAE